MENQFKEIIANENKKNPMTDEQIRSSMGISKDKIIELRKKLKIPNSRERQYPFLYEDEKKIYLENKNISNRDLTAKVNEIGYEVSRVKVIKILKDIEEKMENEIDDKNIEEKSSFIHNEKAINIKKESVDGIKNKENKEKTLFSSVIGCDGSIKLQIRQAQASIQYPPNGLHTVIVGDSGVGKSQLAKAMHEYAISTKNFADDAPFIEFNCADYSDNPQLLLSQLFGYAKGAFTGADKDKKGLVEIADGGILFLDEVHRLPCEGQEILFSILDKGIFRRLGESNYNRKVNLMIIAATTEKLSSSILIAFKRRIPMMIELPNLSNRTSDERLKMIKYFFNEESKRTNKNIRVDKEALRVLLLYKSLGNIGQLRGDIQVSCAKSFLNSLLEGKDSIHVKISDLPNHARVSMLDVDRNKNGKGVYIDNDLYFYVYEGEASSIIESERYILPKTVYTLIEERSKELTSQGLSIDEINNVIGREVESEFNHFVRNTKINTGINKLELKNLVGINIINTVDKSMEIAKSFYKNLQDNIYYFLAIHLSATYERVINGEIISNTQLDTIIEKYPDEYAVAVLIGEQIEKDLNISMPKGEIGFIAMYLRNFSDIHGENNKKVGMVILTHGDVGISIAAVVNKLLNVNHAVGIAMNLDESPQVALDKATKIIKEIDEGRGCILMVDMGSLSIFGGIISKETGIRVETLEKVHTLMALEATRKAIISNSSMEDILASISTKKAELNIVRKDKGISNNKNLKKAIITICMTGEGSANKIEEYIKDVIDNNGEDIEVLSVGLIYSDVELKGIMSKYNVIAFVGTINPNIEGIPFVSMEKLFEEEGVKHLNNIIKDGDCYEISYKVKDECESKSIVDVDLIFRDVKLKNKNDVIDFAVNKLEEREYVKDSFHVGVYKRETMIPTYIKGGIAAPHGFSRDVRKASLVVIFLDKGVQWEQTGKKVDIIFLIAYKENSKEKFKGIFKILMDEIFLQKLRVCENEEEVYEKLVSKCNSYH